jgi:hypothetical protein
MSPIEAEAMRLYARLRALRDYGVPFKAKIHLDLRSSRPLRLALRCLTCGTASEDYGATEEQGWGWLLSYALDWQAWQGCNHLAALLGPDPEEVVALTALALLEAL